MYVALAEYSCKMLHGHIMISRLNKLTNMLSTRIVFINAAQTRDTPKLHERPLFAHISHPSHDIYTLHVFSTFSLCIACVWTRIYHCNRPTIRLPHSHTTQTYNNMKFEELPRALQLLRPQNCDDQRNQYMWTVGLFDRVYSWRMIAAEQEQPLQD